MDLNELVVFSNVARHGSFTAAAAELHMPKSTVSRKVSELETRLGARLFQRTTRKLSLTDAGRLYYERSARIVEQVEEADRAIANLQETPRGSLRVTAPLSFGLLGAPLAKFLQAYPEVGLELVCTDRVVDLIEEGFDVGIRAGRLKDSSLITRSLGSVRRFVVASPDYLKRRGRPRRPTDLAKHECMQFGPSRGAWQLYAEGRKVEVRVSSRFAANDMDILHDAAVAGLGIALIPLFRCAGDLKKRRLERVLEKWSSDDTPIQAVYPSTRQLSPKVKAFVEHLQAALAIPPWEGPPV